MSDPMLTLESVEKALANAERYKQLRPRAASDEPAPFWLDDIVDLAALCRQLEAALRDIITAEWMVTHDWGGDRKAVIDAAEATLALMPTEGESDEN